MLAWEKKEKEGAGDGGETGGGGGGGSGYGYEWNARAAPDGTVLMTEPVEFSPARMFTETVVTGLPYRRRRTVPFDAEGVEGEGHFDAVMVSEDSLVMVSSVSVFAFTFSALCCVWCLAVRLLIGFGVL